ncbi:hypothetical protein CY34DRAFT_806244 [Suillus luteus UH-Slu-Lm8-n1]|uniref:DHHA2 domain-containing protein n=1 Tax=Suillus luteus UH-Slu-Lm8-n1 TaxID=930992 RepID=A0A0D0ATG8_9AGAM|nr:hypothetical protein CY34DRAFT_806244 [Suillus luteus UH-Slu-Lm8-n1]
MGNEAGDMVNHVSLALTDVLCRIDLDSLASALGYAWLRSTTRGKAITYTATLEEDFALRAENLYALGLAGINIPFEELYCSDDPIISMPSQVSQFALVDHNIFRITYASTTASVVADTVNPRIVEPAGSCSSLVARSYQSFSNLSIPPELSTLLLSANLIDTNGLKTGGKALDVDREAAAFLIPQSLLAHNEESLSATLGEKKLSVSRLSTQDLLRRDYKKYVFSMPVSEDATQSSNVIRVGLATVPPRLSAFFASSSYPTKEIQDWFAERDLSVLGILTTFRNQKGKARRERFWIVKADKGIAEKVWQGLESSEVLELKRFDLSKVAGSVNAGEESEGEDAEEATSDEAQFGESYVARTHKQGNTSAMRKQTAPILRKLMDGL